MLSSFTNWKIGTRLSLGFGLVLLLLILALALSIQRLATFNTAFSQLALHRVPNMTAAEDWQRYLQDTGLKMRNILIVESRDEIQRQIEAVHDDQKMRADIVKQLSEEIALPEARTILQQAIAAREVYRPLEQQFLDLVAGNDMAAAKKLLLESARPAQIKNIEAIGKLVEFEKTAVIHSADSTAAIYVASRAWLLVLGFIALIVGSLAAVVITRGVLGQLGGEPGEAATIAGHISQGNLDVQITLKPGDQSSMLFAMESMRARLTEIVSQVRLGATHMAESVGQIAQGTDDLNQRTQEQAAAIEETASSMEEMTSTVKQNAENARHASDLAASTRIQAERGGVVVQSAIQATSAINDSSRQIVDIISVIDEIAFQTNLLALNAAVESARAGEQGRGFAVVANEVRSLAQRSAAAAKEIKVLIQDSVEKVKTGTELVNASGATLNEIISGVKKVSDVVGEIVIASGEQSVGIEQINDAIAQMDAVTQQNAALVEEATAASKNIEDDALTLSKQIAFFKTATIPTAQSPAVARTQASPPPATRSRTVSPLRKVARVSGGEDSWQEF